MSRYYYPGTKTLVNKKGIADAKILSAVERNVVAARTAQLLAQEPLKDFGPAGISAIHGTLYGDLYDWAGRFRDYELSSGGRRRVSCARIGNALSAVGYSARTDRDGRDGLVDALTGIVRDINDIAPFPKGNNYVSKVYAEYVAKANDYEIKWDRVKDQDFMSAVRGSMAGDASALHDMIDKNLVYRGRQPEKERTLSEDRARAAAEEEKAEKQRAARKAKQLGDRGADGSVLSKYGQALPRPAAVPEQSGPSLLQAVNMAVASAPRPAWEQFVQAGAGTPERTSMPSQAKKAGCSRDLGDLPVFEDKTEDTGRDMGDDW